MLRRPDVMRRGATIVVLVSVCVRCFFVPCSVEFCTNQNPSGLDDVLATKCRRIFSSTTPPRGTHALLG